MNVVSVNEEKKKVFNLKNKDGKVQKHFREQHCKYLSPSAVLTVFIPTGMVNLLTVVNSRCIYTCALLQVD